ncbi:MAG: organoarsenical effux MFS transporter ArsJ [Silicimonas sp.]|nr:organoarsenical effux MFS transporter ArsJ [Silicimonas sp.]
MSDNGLKAYIAVTAAYWAFMLTDGALRMLVLLHFHTLGFSPVELAYLFLLYEVMGIVTNLSAGWLAGRFGMTSTLFAGLLLQIGALLALAALDPAWCITVSVAYVMAVQGASGVAKDLAKMSSKSAVKVLAPSEDRGLFRWVAALTGSKNAVKGIGFLVGATLLGAAGFRPSVLLMAAVLAVVLLGTVLFMPPGLPPGKRGTKISAVWPKDADIRALSLARVFLFGARDTWFVVGIPIFFYAALSDGTPEGNREAFFLVGSFMSAWIIFYGGMQAAAPRWLRGQTQDIAATVRAARNWVGILATIPALLAIAAALALPGLVPLIVAGLLIFAVVFAFNSALHSYLILAFSSAERVTMDVGFYYMANAAGRLLGTLLSGLSFQVAGVAGCLASAAGMAALGWLSTKRLTSRHGTQGNGLTED